LSRIIGIDLGTTNSAVAVVNEYGRPEILTNREGGRVTPSVVMFDGDSPVVGEIAKASAAMRPLDTVQFVKRHMGSRDWSFRTSSGASYSPEDISATILARLKADAEEKLGEKITRAVITVPAYFDDACRTATIDAARIAGLEVDRLLNEPTAAALAYGLDSKQSETVMVYDLGGGTFDVTVMRLEGNDFKVLATDGDKQLGGFDWDNMLMEWLNQQFAETGGPSLINDPESEQMLRDNAVRAKHTLSTRDEAKVFLAYRGFNAQIPLSRQKFDDITAPLLNRTARTVEKVLEDANLGWKDINKVVMVGGSSRMRQVGDLIERISGDRPSVEVNPDEIVALGAALQAAILSGQTVDGSSPVPITDAAGNRITNVSISDITAHSLGVVSNGINPDRNEMREINSIIIPKGTPIPCEMTEEFCTMNDNQGSFLCRVNEGEDTDLRYVRPIGEGEIRLAGTGRAGTPVFITLSYSANGIVSVFARDTDNRLLGELRVNRVANMSEIDVDRSRDRMENVEIA
jgi:molecular chaperone DnaK